MFQVLAALLPWKMIARAALAKYLEDPALKDQIIKDLRDGAQKTETKYDDAAVNTVEQMWSYIVPVLAKKL